MGELVGIDCKKGKQPDFSRNLCGECGSGLWNWEDDGHGIHALTCASCGEFILLAGVVQEDG